MQAHPWVHFSPNMFCLAVGYFGNQRILNSVRRLERLRLATCG